MPISNILVENYIHDLGIMQKHQLDDEAQYMEWAKIMTALFKCGRQIRTSQEWTSISEAQTLPEHSEIYELLQQAFDMIGDVNGYPLRRDSDSGILIAAYTCISYADTTASNSGPAKSRAIFRLRIEHYFARKIIEQQSKSPAMLADDLYDLRLVRRLRNRKHDSLKQRCPQENSEMPSPNISPSINIDFTSFVVRCNLFKCNKNHDIEQIRAIVDIMMPAGTIISEEVAAGYCRDCNLYFIFDSDYVRLREQGILLCQLVSQKTYEQEGHETFGRSDLKPESILHQSGYNVSSSDNLSDIQRQEILRRVIENRLYSKTALLSFLDWLISRNEKVSRKDMSGALQKWRTDRNYVASYKLEVQRTVKVGKLVK